jgi:hypothetical protein
MSPYQTHATSAATTLYALFVAVALLTAVDTPLNAQADVTTALNGTARQAYNPLENVLVSSAMQSGAVVPTQPSWSPLPIDPVAGGAPNGVYAQPCGSTTSPQASRPAIPAIWWW